MFSLTEDFDIEDAKTFELTACKGVYYRISENFLAVCASLNVLVHAVTNFF